MLVFPEVSWHRQDTRADGSSPPDFSHRLAMETTEEQAAGITGAEVMVAREVVVGCVTVAGLVVVDGAAAAPHL